MLVKRAHRIRWGLGEWLAALAIIITLAGSVISNERRTTRIETIVEMQVALISAMNDSLEKSAIARARTEEQLRQIKEQLSHRLK